MKGQALTTVMIFRFYCATTTEIPKQSYRAVIQPPAWLSYCSNLGLETPDTEITYYEVKVSLSSIGLNENTPFAIDVQINDDDNGDDRDSKWAWFAPSGQDSTWYDPSQLGPAILQPAY